MNTRFIALSFIVALSAAPAFATSAQVNGSAGAAAVPYDSLPRSNNSHDGTAISTDIGNHLNSTSSGRNSSVIHNNGTDRSDSVNGSRGSYGSSNTNRGSSYNNNDSSVGSSSNGSMSGSGSMGGSTSSYDSGSSGSMGRSNGGGGSVGMSGSGNVGGSVGGR